MVVNVGPGGVAAVYAGAEGIAEEFAYVVLGGFPYYYFGDGIRVKAVPHGYAGAHEHAEPQGGSK